MFELNASRVVYLHRDAIDFRKNINGLASLVEHALGMNAFANAVSSLATAGKTVSRYWAGIATDSGYYKNASKARALFGLEKTVQSSNSRCNSCTGCSMELTSLRCVVTLLFPFKKRPETY